MTINIRIGKRELIGADIDDTDARGILWIWEPPRPSSTYVLGCDPSYGIAGWNRSLRTENDEETDNCAIQVIRKGNTRQPDVQVAEFAAPIDAEDAAAHVNFIGRMYAGASEEEQAHAIIEVHPGPGLLTMQELVNHYGYTNLYVWKHLDQLQVKPTLSYGWYSSRQSRQALWIRSTRHITKNKGITLNSPWLIEEMTDCQPDSFLSFTARAAYGRHDDRVVALFLSIWAAREWDWDNPPEEAEKPTVTNAPDYQASDISYEDMVDEWNTRFASLQGDA